MSERTCLRCDDVITGEGEKFCGHSCYNAHRAEGAERRKQELPVCAAEGCNNRVAKKTRNKYCSPECGYTSPARKPPPPELELCEHCGGPRGRYNAKYCSPACVYAARTHEPDASLSAENYQIIGDQIVFTVRGKLVKMPIDRWDSICRDYSDYGGGMTIAQVARKHGIPQPAVRRMLASYGQYHSSPPMSRERIAEAEDLDPLVAEAIEAKEYRLIQRIERAREQVIEREHREMLKRLRDEERHTEAAKEIVEGLTVIVPSTPDTISGTEIVAAHVPTTDEHIGSYVWGAESFGENLTADIAATMLRRHAGLVVDWLGARGGVETVYRTFLGDLLHGRETEHGTRLDLDTREARVWSLALAAVVESVGALLQVARNVVVKLIAGNHDAHDTAKLRAAVQLAFAGEPRVTVEPSPMRYAAFRVGDTLHVLDHGYRVGKSIPASAQVNAEVVAREVGGDDFHNADWVYTYIGHLHQRAVQTLGEHHEIVRLPAFTESDHYSTEGRYPGRPAARAYLLDARGRHLEERVFHSDVLRPAGEG